MGVCVCVTLITLNNLEHSDLTLTQLTGTINSRTPQSRACEEDTLC